MSILYSVCFSANSEFFYFCRTINEVRAVNRWQRVYSLKECNISILRMRNPADKPLRVQRRWLHQSL